MRRVVVVAFPGVQPLDVVGPAEVFHTAAQLHGGGYDVEIVAPEPGTLKASALTLSVDRALADVAGPIDTLIVAGGVGVRALEDDEHFVAALRDAAARSRRVAGVCTGAFLLAAAGLLEGRRATTHWASCGLLADSHPDVAVDPDPIFVRDGHVYTSAGVTAGMDLALALVEEDLGRETALTTARWLVLFVKRPGGQAQFSAQLHAQQADRRPLRELQAWIADNVDADLSVPALAERAHMSERNFARAFAREVGMTPAAYVECARVESARMALEAGDVPVETVAARAGFGTVETMRRAFHRRVGVGPADYRRRFRSDSSGAHPAEPDASATAAA
jgi:transcriptional regulator GlxA family with amidase domain